MRRSNSIAASRAIEAIIIVLPLDATLAVEEAADPVAQAEVVVAKAFASADQVNDDEDSGTSAVADTAS